MLVKVSHSALCYRRASLASLPLLGQAIGTLPLGTWSTESLLVQRESNGMTEVGSTGLHAENLQSVSGKRMRGETEAVGYLSADNWSCG